MKDIYDLYQFRNEHSLSFEIISNATRPRDAKGYSSAADRKRCSRVVEATIE